MLNAIYAALPINALRLICSPRSHIRLQRHNGIDPFNAQGKADEYEGRYQTAMKTINQLKTGIHSIFSRIG